MLDLGIQLSVYASAERYYNAVIKKTFCGSDQPHQWWTTLRLVLFGVDSSVPPLVEPDGCIIHSPVEKVTVFADVFDSKQGNEKREIPLSCFLSPS